MCGPNSGSSAKMSSDRANDERSSGTATIADKALDRATDRRDKENRKAPEALFPPLHIESASELYRDLSWRCEIDSEKPNYHHRDAGRLCNFKSQVKRFGDVDIRQRALLTQCGHKSVAIGDYLEKINRRPPADKPEVGDFVSTA